MHKSIRNTFYAVQILIGWDYFVSGCNKIFYAGFPYHLGSMLKGLNGQGLSGLYINILKATVIPFSVPFGYLIELGEFFAGLALIVLSLILLFKKSENDLFFKGFSIILLLAALGTTFMSINYWLMGGAPPFWPGQSPWGSGMDIDSFTAILSVIIVWFNAVALKNTFVD